MGIGAVNFELGNVFEGIGNLAKDIRTALTGREPIDANKAAEIAIKVQELENSVVLGQLKINEAEATNPSLFVSGWRPAAGWVCVSGLAYTFLLQPIMAWASDIYKCPVPPAIDMSMLFNLLVGMLGLAGVRAYEKVQKVAAK